MREKVQSKFFFVLKNCFVSSFQVFLQPVHELSFKQGMHLETVPGAPLALGLRMTTVLEDSGDADPVLFTDCADVPYKVALSDNKNFELDTEASEC